MPPIPEGERVEGMSTWEMICTTPSSASMSACTMEATLFKRVLLLAAKWNHHPYISCFDSVKWKIIFFEKKNLTILRKAYVMSSIHSCQSTWPHDTHTVQGTRVNMIINQIWRRKLHYSVILTWKQEVFISKSSPESYSNWHKSYINLWYQWLPQVV